MAEIPKEKAKPKGRAKNTAPKKPTILPTPPTAPLKPSPKKSKTAEPKVKTIEERIEAERDRLTKIYKGIEEKRKQTVRGVIERAAYMLVQLQNLEADLLENGMWEMFSQGDQEPYERKRPAADLYNQINNSYQKIIKQLTDLLPKEEPKVKEEGDGFDEFVVNRK